MAIFFKGGEQLFNEAIDLVGRKNYKDAKRKFLDAIEKGYSNDGLANVYASLITVGESRSNIGSYKALLNDLNNISVGTFKFGLTDVVVEDLRTECQLDIDEITANNMNDSDYKAKGNAFIECAGKFSSMIGDKSLILDEIFKGNTMATGTREGLILQAEGYAILGKGAVNADPKLAAEYMQMAYNFRKQLGDSGSEELELSKDYARSATCWICGRPANAQGIHFMAMKSTIEPVFANMTTNDVVKPLSDDMQSIYVCTPCYTAISNKSDEISRHYYDSAMAEMRAMEARIDAELAALRFSVRR